jgi:hypothetical protein
MPVGGILGRGLTFDLPNYVGSLIQLGREDAPFFSAIGGLTGGKATDAVDFKWQAYDLRPEEDPNHLEGQQAPVARHRRRIQLSNVVQILHSTVDVSYTKLATTRDNDGVGNELDWQLDKELRALKMDTEHIMLNGTYSFPSDLSAPRKTRGLRAAIQTNRTALGGALTKTAVNNALQGAYLSGGFSEQSTGTIMLHPTVKRWFTYLFLQAGGGGASNYVETSRNVGGLNLQTIETDFGRLNLMMNRFCSASEVIFVDLSVCAPVFLNVPGKGFLFVEPLAKTGANDASQIYGEVGLEYGNEAQHAILTGVTAPAGFTG